MEDIFASLALVTTGNRILSASRRGRPRDLGLPGGKRRPNESPEDAACRELFEEAGLVPKGAPRHVFTDLDTYDGAKEARLVSTFFVPVDPRLVPRQMEVGIEIQYVHIHLLLTSSCSYRAYNEKLFKSLRLI